jgi:hypothetical protein
MCGWLAMAAPAVVLGQTNSYITNGVEYAIVGALPGDQSHPSLGVNATGGYIVWEDNLTDGDGLGISARRLDSTLSGWYSPFRVNATGAGDQERPQVALLSSGGAVFVWQGGVRDSQRIYARFLSAGGTWLTLASDVLVNTFTNNFQVNPAVATLANGNVVVTWGSYNQFSANSMQDVYARLFTPSGQPIGGEFLVNSFISYNQRTPAVAGLSDGRFVIAWASEQERFENSVDLYARIFSAGGVAAGNEILVSSASTNVCANPNLVPTQNGGFIVAWSEKDLTNPRTNSWDVSARAFNSAGAPSGASMRLNQFRFGDQYGPRLAMIGWDLLAVWTSLNQDGSREGVVGRFFSADLTPLADEFVVNTTTVGPQIHPVVAADGQARFLVAWGGFVGVASGLDLFAQRYASTLLPPPAPDPPFVTLLSWSAMTVSWPPLAGFNVASYEVYADGAATPTASVTNTWWTMSGLQPNSTHCFQLDYLLADGRRSAMSGATTNTTYGTYSWGGIPYDWMAYCFGWDVFSWPSPYADTDHDGVSNLNEFLGGTNPMDPASVLRTRLQSTAQGFYLNWNTQPGLIYQVQTSPNLKGWTNLGGMRFAPGAVDSVYVGGRPASYYRVLRVR